MAKATGKRGHRTKADEALSRKATQHHDFVGQAEPDREQSRTVEEGIDLIRQRGPDLLEALRAKAEQRLDQMPASVKSAVRLTERAVGMALWPVRAGAHPDRAPDRVAAAGSGGAALSTPRTPWEAFQAGGVGAAPRGCGRAP